MIPKIFTYNENKITFQRGESVMVNATEMAKPFGKRPSKWLELPSTQEFISTLGAIRKSDRLIETVNGIGTWLHEDVAIEFARWLSPAFAIWCNDRIKELIQDGVTTTATDDEAILRAMQVLQKRVEDSKQRLQIVEAERDHYQAEVKELTPNAEYTDKVLQSTSTLTTNQIAQELGMSAKALNKKLEELKIQYRQGKQWLVYSKYRDMGIVSSRTYSYTDSVTMEVKTSTLMVWTERGKNFIYSLIRGGGS